MTLTAKILIHIKCDIKMEDLTVGYIAVSRREQFSYVLCLRIDCYRECLDFL